MQAVGNFRVAKDMITHANKSMANDKKVPLELRGALPPDVYINVHGCKTTKEFWDVLKGKYQGNEKIKKSLVMKCLSERADFKQKKKNKNIEASYDKMNDLLFRCIDIGQIVLL